MTKKTIFQCIIVGFLVIPIVGIFFSALKTYFLDDIYNDWKETIKIQAEKESVNNLGKKIVSLSEENEESMSKEELGFWHFMDIKKAVFEFSKETSIKTVSAFSTTIGSISKTIGVEFLFKLPTELLTSDELSPTFNLIDGLALSILYIFVIYKYFASMISSLNIDQDIEMISEVGNFLLSVISIFLARFIALAVVSTIGNLSNYLFANGIQDLFINILTRMNESIYQSVLGGDPTFVQSIVFVIFILLFLILFLFILVKNAKRYFIVLILAVMSPIFTPLIFFKEFSGIASIYWKTLVYQCSTLLFDLLIISVGLIFVQDELTLKSFMSLMVLMFISVSTGGMFKDIVMAPGLDAGSVRGTARNIASSSKSLYSSGRNMANRAGQSIGNFLNRKR